MSITKTTHYKHVDGKQIYEPTTKELYVGRVLKIENTFESRNWSDTLDYSDFRTTSCTYALVWMGTRGVPAHHVPSARPKGRDVVWYAEGDVPEYAKDRVRDLEFWEQFAWVDCTNIFADRNGFSLGATVDADGGDPLMWANYLAWQGHQVALTEKARREEEVRAEEARKEQAARAAKAAAKVAKDDAKRKAAEALLALVPSKGTKVTVDGFTGKVFWMGAKKHYGKWGARVGVKDDKGNVGWFDATKVRA